MTITMDYTTKFNRAFSPWFVDKASYIELVGSDANIKTQYRNARIARKDAMNFADRLPFIETADISQPLAEVECWRPYGDERYPFVAGTVIRVALPQHVFQDAFGLILWSRPVDNKFFVRVTKKDKVVMMVLSKNEMLPNIGMLSSKIMEKLNGKN